MNETHQQIIARFESREQVNAALSGLEKAGAVDHSGDLPYPGAGRAVLHFSVRSRDVLLARSIILRAGGRV